MAGKPGRSGGSNARTLQEHQLAGTYRKDKHGHLLAAATPPPQPVSLAARRRVLAGLPDHARRVAVALLDEYGNWTASQLETLKAYSLSCDRLNALQVGGEADADAIHRETRCCLSLLTALKLE